jgi:hypothetical protein
MNKQDIIDGLLELDRYSNAVKAAIAVLKTITEPKPDFYVGWVGETRNGLVAEIHAETDGMFYGFIRLNTMVPSAARWGRDGTFDERQGKTSNDLIPNTPPEPEIWYRGKSQSALFHYASDIPDGCVVEKVEVRVVT